MSIEWITLLMFGGLVLLLAMGLPLAFATGLIGVGFTAGLFGMDGLQLVASRIYSFMNEYALVSVPMFVMMASILERSGVARDLFDAMRVWAGGMAGGLGIQTMVVATLMGAMTGIIGGEIVLLGLLALPQMLRLGYDRKLAIGTICAGGSLGTMIPPSIVLVIYGLTVNVSIGDLFTANLVPGLVLSGAYMAYIAVRCALNPALGPPAPREERALPLRRKLALLKGLLLPLLVVGSVLGTIYAGWASVTEAAGMGVAGTLLAAALRGELRWATLRESCRQTLSTCGMLLWLSFGATAMIGVYNLAGGPEFVKELITGLPLPPLGQVAVMMAILLVLGCIMDWVGICLLTMPIFVPIVTAMGYDPVWFGVLFCLNMQVSYLSPPFGPAAFYLKGVAPEDVTLNEIFSAVWPFIGLQLVVLAVVMLLPGVALWLPGLKG
ncbi:MAG: TRAP transporter large permease subunit [Betaproteobacteria bacterium]|jgi:tripartite ATP-independent transporter DctM subunit|nr:TRAP transporter large permease subunit [Rhodocyclaceae bacterium]MCA3136122.1 TRAP transporter large permease subunit [Rhodocyclaceae bacterium]MCA3143410.1 TRAP transporter large permease subunit [Rhodocyclaceae bacterium]MCA3147012.1 TRAP transporter large permease subunit [Rhodocyclaceae bacterium]MCE2898580.1 TRAP transporter large permease subunit [Betaproteobacteria bacterium]